MSANRIRAWGLVSLIVAATACEIDHPPARHAIANGVDASGLPARVATAAANGHAFGQAVSHGGQEADPTSGSGSAAGSPGVDAPAGGVSGHEPDTATAADAEPATASSTGAAEDGRAAAPTPAERVPGEERFPRPRAVRGLYANAWAAGSSSRMDELLAIARRTEVNALVIDIKDATGYVSHPTEVALANEIGATGEIRIRDLPGLLGRLERENVYPIARIVIVRDPILAEFRPELAVNDTAGGVWVDGKGLTWINPYARDAWNYHVALAREVARLGFPEIQFDYVRFPDAPEDELARAVFLGSDGRSKPTAIREFLQYARESLDDLDVQLTADVFGVTTSARRDVGIGQVWESFIDAVDVALPMVYPSHYWEGSFGFRTPNAYPYEVVRGALRDAVGRSAGVDGAGHTRPWLQDFTLGSPAYTSAEVRAQIQATYDAGIEEWILWNPGSRYTELALQPVEGFEREPYIRVADRLVPVSERWAVLDSVSAARSAARAPAATQESPVLAEPAVPADTVGAQLN